MLLTFHVLWQLHSPSSCDQAVSILKLASTVLAIVGLLNLLQQHRWVTDPLCSAAGNPSAFAGGSLRLNSW